jgi:hypothetical protein
MGTLTKYDLSGTGCTVFFETGTGLGHSLQHALDSGKSFEKLYSTEIHRPTASRAQRKFSKHSKVEIMCTDSISALKLVLPSIPIHTPIFFFLDAHFPGEVESGFEYEKHSPTRVSMPLEEELNLIHTARPSSSDIIVVDDWRIYEIGNYESGNLSNGFANLSEGWRHSKFLHRVPKSKIIEKHSFDDGYLLIKPAESKFTLKKVSPIFRARRSIKRSLRKFGSR